MGGRGVLALVSVAISAIGGAVYFGPQARRIGEALRAEGPQSERAKALIGAARCSFRLFER